MTARIQEQYYKEIRPALVKRFGYSNVMMAPRLEKITLNVGVGEGHQSPNLLEDAVQTLRQVTGQHPSVRKAKKSIANFKLREGMPVGAMCTLRKSRMWEFYDRLINTALPQVRDFRGMPTTCFDGHGNYTIGVREQIVFPEIDIDKVAKIRGMNITLVTTARTDEEGLELLRLLQFPFRKN
jgi:large subunit ribosomal protein L5